jgi:hypothetical protein
VGFVASTGSAEFFNFNLARGGLFVFSSAVVFAFALCTLKMNNIAHEAVL